MNLNYATKTITAIIGIVLALGGIIHGYFAFLQGNNPTNSLIIQSISKAHQSWPNGEEAFTLIPNFLITGIVAILVSLIIIYWSVFAIHRNHGRTVFLLLFVLLTLVGGGIGHIVFFLPTWGYATRIYKPLNWWRKIFSRRMRNSLAKTWKFLLLATSISFIISLAISVFGLPGTSDKNIILAVCWSFLLFALILLNYTYIAGFSSDIKNQEKLRINEKNRVQNVNF